jgi:hypothetical protein
MCFSLLKGSHPTRTLTNFPSWVPHPLPNHDSSMSPPNLIVVCKPQVPLSQPLIDSRLRCLTVTQRSARLLLRQQHVRGPRQRPLQPRCLPHRHRSRWSRQHSKARTCQHPLLHVHGRLLSPFQRMYQPPRTLYLHACGTHFEERHI